MSEVEEQQVPDTNMMHLAYAEASVMVLECLMRLLIERKVVSLDEVLEAIGTASETKRTLARTGAHPEIARVATGVLSTLANSLAAGTTLPPTGDHRSAPPPQS